MGVISKLYIDDCDLRDIVLDCLLLEVSPTAIPVEPLANLTCKLPVPTAAATVATTKILLDVEEGVMETDSPDISVKLLVLADAKEAVSVLVVDTTCSILPVLVLGNATLPSELSVIPSELADELRIESTTIRDIVYPPMVLGCLPLPLQRDLSM